MKVSIWAAPKAKTSSGLPPSKNIWVIKMLSTRNSSTKLNFSSRSRRHSPTPKNAAKSKSKSVTDVARLERDAQLLANRIALLKQEEMKTWKKIEETKKKTTDILGLKRRNEDRLRKVSTYFYSKTLVVN